MADPRAGTFTHSHMSGLASGQHTNQSLPVKQRINHWSKPNNIQAVQHQPGVPWVPLAPTPILPPDTKNRQDNQPNIAFTSIRVRKGTFLGDCFGDPEPIETTILLTQGVTPNPNKIDLGEIRRREGLSSNSLIPHRSFYVLLGFGLFDHCESILLFDNILPKILVANPATSAASAASHTTTSKTNQARSAADIRAGNVKNLETDTMEAIHGSVCWGVSSAIHQQSLGFGPKSTAEPTRPY